MIAIALIGGIAVLLAKQFDLAAENRQQTVVDNGLADRMAEVAHTVVSDVVWDDTVRHIQNHFDAGWVSNNIGTDLFQTHGFEKTAVLSGDDRQRFVADRGVPVDSSKPSAFVFAARPLVADVRAAEARRGSNRAAHQPGRPIAESIQSTEFARLGQETYILTATLVQPDFGTVTPLPGRAPIVLTGRLIDKAFVEQFAHRYLLNGARLARAGRSPGASGPQTLLRDRAGEVVAAIAWLPEAPGTALLGRLAMPIGLLVGAFGCTAVYFYRRSQRLERQRVRALDEATAALAVKSEFLANMTHELRTPLNAILGFSGLLRRASDLSPPDARRIELVWDASQTLLGIVNDVLDFSKLEARALEFEAHAFEPAAVVESTTSLLADQAAAKGLTLSWDIRGLDGWLLGDSARLRQVLTNLISNAIKFTSQGSIQVLVTQTDQVGGRRLRMAVTDTGIGIPSDRIDSIFGRFAQADASVTRKFGGTGLGLAISKQIVEAMDGAIGVESTPGAGSTFWFEVSLPVAAAPAIVDEPALVFEVDRAPRLLVVDDNAVNRELLCTLLAPFGLDIETAVDGFEAVAAVADREFDVILMDVQMPNMDGLTATRHIRDATPPAARRTPIIAMTANVLPEQIQRCLDAGMDDHVGKPFDLSHLLTTLAHWSPGAETEAEHGERNPDDAAFVAVA